MKSPSISVIIPALNEARDIGRAIDNLKERTESNFWSEIIVVDGWSDDDTASIARSRGAKVVITNIRDRGTQLNNGGREASGNVLYFVHADTRPPRGFDTAITTAVNRGYNAGCFRLRFDVKHPILALVSFFSRFSHDWCRAGDQSLFMTREVFENSGGFATRRGILEDTEIIPRIKKLARFTVIPDHVVTSARRYMQRGILRLQAFYIILRILDVQHFPLPVLRHVYRFRLSSGKNDAR